MIDDKSFFAWLDGELGPEESAKVAAIVERDPALGAKAERHRSMNARLRGAFEPLAAEPVPLPRADVIDFAAARRLRSERRWWQDAAALAATLVLGLVVGTRFAVPDSAPVTVSGDRLVASAALERSLDRQLASAPAGGDHRIGLTFRDGDGRICRTFGSPSSSGLACRQADEWAVEALVGPAEGQSGQFRMAAGADPRLADMVDAIISGEPFDATQEKAARDRGWTSR